MILLAYLPPSRIKPSILQREIVNLGVHLNGKLLHRLADLWVSLFEQLDRVALMTPMDDTLRANRVRIAIEAEVLDFFFRMILAKVAYSSIGLVNPSRC